MPESHHSGLGSTPPRQPGLAEPTAGADHAELRRVSAGELDKLAWLPIDQALLPAVGPLLS